MIEIDENEEMLNEEEDYAIALANRGLTIADVE